ncbi:SDR family NAD(P)-dependent oxidoreductase [Chitinophaga sp. Cy-1792]|uniref:SDR family NAD(P)-dependent oxidoreductase n=1 Tax=Chitinophaga sp. Cy-1792 TaxID=2608339 RepID=UPI001423F176|nr:glucose 1-dehydrogenase [Chitinophaga sp. Cy-1792]NIG55081.1 glucose 1-dehydrogenase [Chitinophaga sp. Cy-1792]
MLLENKVALVTGASLGIGRAVAIDYAANGAKVVLTGRTEATLKAVTEEIKAAGGDAIYVVADVSIPEDCERMVEETVARYGQLDIACNNAGILKQPKDTDLFSIDDWKETIDINLNGMFYSMKYEIPVMLANGGGAIVNMSSVGGRIGLPGIAAYIATKHANVGLTLTSALEYATRNIRINAVGPAFIDTPLVSNNFGGMEEMLNAAQPIGRMGTAEEVAYLVTFLSSHKASFATGGYYPIDGGFMAR